MLPHFWGCKHAQADKWKLECQNIYFGTTWTHSSVNGITYTLIYFCSQVNIDEVQFLEHRKDMRASIFSVVHFFCTSAVSTGDLTISPTFSAHVETMCWGCPLGPEVAGPHLPLHAHVAPLEHCLSTDTVKMNTWGCSNKNIPLGPIDPIIISHSERTTNGGN